MPKYRPSMTRQLPPGGLPSPPQRKRKRDGSESSLVGGEAPSTAADSAEKQYPDVRQPAEQPPAKRRATRTGGSLMKNTFPTES